MRRAWSLAAGALAAGIATLGPAAVCAQPLHPKFEPESLSAFAGATHGDSRLRVADGKHFDPKRYHAYRFLDPDNVIVGVAQDITVDPTGHIVVHQEPGSPLGGRPNKTHHEFSHLLLPIGVTPPR